MTISGYLQCLSSVFANRLVRCGLMLAGFLCWCSCGAERQRTTSGLSSLKATQSEFTFDPFNARFVVPFPDNGACHSVGVFDNQRVGVVIDKIFADGAPIKGREVILASLDAARTVIIENQGGYIYLVYGAELDSFVDVKGNNLARFSLPMEEDHVPVKEIVIHYRVRCANSRLTEQFILRGRNGGL
jgi:hypothetical protein